MHDDLDPVERETEQQVRLARRAGQQGGTAPAVYNAANEVCVEAFRTGGLAFVDIVDTVAALLDQHDVDHRRVNSHDVGSGRDLTVDDVLAADAWARAHTLKLLKDLPA